MSENSRHNLRHGGVWLHNRFALCLSICLLAMASDAATGTGNDLVWTYSIKNGEASVDGVTTTSSYNPSGAIVIPSSLGGCPVTSIGDSAFKCYDKITSVTIPTGVKTIGSSAFSNCSLLSAVSIPNTVTTIGNAAFYGCRDWRDGGLKSVVIPDSVTSVGSSAFAYCDKLKSVVIGNGVISIGVGAFTGCSCLTNVTIPDSVIDIGADSFRDCSSLTTVSMGNGLIHINNRLFYGCSNLSSVHIGNGVTRISASAFTGCKDSLFNETMIPGVKIVDGWAVGYTSAIEGVLDLTGVRGIGDSAFTNSTALASVKIPNGVTHIGANAFNGCSGLTDVTIPDSVIYVGSSAFDNCSGLAEAYISDVASWCRVFFENISANPLYNAHKLFLDNVLVEHLIIPEGSTGIGQYAFSGCNYLNSISIPYSVTTIGRDAFTGCANVKNATVPGWGCGIPFDNVTNVIISAGTTKIRDSAFWDCSRIANIEMPDSVIEIERCAFTGCSGLTSISMPDNVTSIGWAAFLSCSSLTNISIPDNLTSIGDYAFSGCSGLRSVSVGGSITSVGEEIFGCCTSLVCVTIKQDILSSNVSALFSSVRQSISNIVVAGSASTIGADAFRDWTGLQNVRIDNGVTIIGDNAFSGCTNLTDIAIPDSLISVGYHAFDNTPFLDNQPDGLVIFNDIAFKMKGACPYSVIIPDAVSSIGDYAFSGCSGLTSVTIPDGVTSIGRYAFQNCRELMSVAIPCSITNIGAYAFSSCRSLAVVEFAGDAPSVGEGAFRWVNVECRGVVSRTSSGWGSPISRTWNDLLICYPWYVVKFDAMGGNCSEAHRTVEHGHSIGELPVPSKMGYIFDGWGLTANDIVLADLKLHAQWTPIKYTVTFDANGGQGGVADKLDYESELVAPSVNRAGYTFLGWSPEVAATVPLGGATYTAQWQINQYDVVFDANGGTGGASTNLDYGMEIVVPSVMRAGYTFVGWSPTVDETVPAHDVTYTAQWTLNKYTVTFDANGGIGGIAGEYDYESELVAPTVAREGYTFLGWSPEVGETVPLGGTTYTAQWAINSYDVVFDANGGEGGTSTNIEYGTAIDMPTVTRAGGVHIQRLVAECG